MAAPVVVACTANTWVLVATAITSATFHRISVLPGVYRMTHVNTGDAAPADDSTAALMFSDSPNEEIFANSVASDFYVKAVGAAGSVRRDA